MSSTTRARLGDLNNSSSLGMSDQTQSYAMQSRNPRPAVTPQWGTGIWGSPIGSGMKSTAETGRTHSRPAPLVRAGLASEDQNEDSLAGTPDEITGSGSLLPSSESEGWSRRWPSMGNINTSLGSGLTSARSNNAGSSPVRHRTNQHTRSNSPYFTQQPSAIGTSTSTKSATGSMLDPTSRSFNAQGVFNGFPQQSLSARHEDDDIVGRRNSSTVHFESLAGTGNATFSGYNSGAPSRSGSMPPSRHGNELGLQFGDIAGSAVFPASADPFSHRQNPHSRTSTFSMNGNINGNKFTNQAWQTTMGDLSTMTGKLDVGRDTADNSYHAYWDQSNNVPSPGSINSLPVGNYINQRHGSISMEPGAGLMTNGIAQYGQQRMYGAERRSYSPTGSDPRRSNESPMYFSGNTPPIPDHTRALSTNSSRANLNAYDHNMLDRKLRGLAEQQQSYQPSPALSYRSTYNSSYDYNSSTTPNIPRANSAISPYYQNTQLGGYASNVATQRMPPRGPANDTSGGGDLRSPLLEEFRLSKGTKRYELKDIYNHVVEFSGDQHGSRFIQQKLETANSDEKAQLFSEILPNALQLMTDVFGNYVIQKFFEHGNQQQKKQLADKMKGHIPELSLQMYGCRVVQKAFEHILVDQQATLVKELENQVLKCVKDQNGNHVIQKAIQRIPAQHISFIINAFTNQVHHLATHPYGCRVIQRMLENCHEPAKTNILDELHICAANLIVDQYGNYVTQHIIEHGRESDRNKVIAIITSNLVSFASQKFASNVVEKSIQFSTVEQRSEIMAVIGGLDERGESIAQRLMRDQFGNYIIQKLIRHLQQPDGSRAEYENLMEILKPPLARLKQFSYGKQIGQMDRLITAGPPSTLTTAQPSSASSITTGHRPPQLDISTAPTPPLVTDSQSPQSSSQPSTSHSTVDEPIGEGTVGGPRKSSTPHVEVADDTTITATTVATPKTAAV